MTLRSSLPFCPPFWLRLGLAAGLLFPALSLGAAAQAHSLDISPGGINYTQGRPWFHTLFGQNPLAVAPLQLANSPRIETLLRDGKLHLSLDDAIALALENNLDIAIQRYNLPIADTDILRARAGASPLGVAVGTLSGTPGGGITAAAGATGSGAGGTSAGVGGAGAGAGGIVASTVGSGPAIPNLDPTFTTSLSIADGETPETNLILTGTNQLASHTGIADFTYDQGFTPGTQLAISYDNTRTSSNNLVTLFNPSLSSGLSVQVTQPLLQGRGIDLNSRNLIIAKDNREIADIGFQQQVMATVTTVEEIYWNTETANEAVTVAQEAVDYAQKLLNDTQREVEIGTQAPLAIAQAEATLAGDQQTLINAQTNYASNEMLLKNAITKNLEDPVIATADVICSDQISPPAQAAPEPVEDLIKQALQYRPELAETRINLTIDQVSLKADINALKPQLNLVGTYASNAIAGALGPAASGVTGLTPFIGGYGTTIGNVLAADYPTYTLGLQYDLTPRNRNAQANVVRSELDIQQAQLQQQQQINNIEISVRQAAFALQQSIAAMAAATAAVQYNRETLEADQKKLDLGATIITQVIQDQATLVQSESNLLAAKINYEENRLLLDQDTGRTLVNNRISILDAENGKVTQMPQVSH